MEMWTVAPLIVLAGWLGVVYADSRAQARAAATSIRLAALERKLDVVMGHLGVAEPPVEHPDVVQHLERGKFIQAIKIYRDRTGVGLAEAKAAVEQIARERGLRDR